MAAKKPSRASGKSKCQTYLLVRWIEEDSVGVMPSTALKKGQMPSVGVITELKYSSKFYEAEILKISGEGIFNELMWFSLTFDLTSFSQTIGNF